MRRKWTAIEWRFTRMLMAYASRNSRDHSRRFPELVKALGGLKPKSFILDGEVAVFDKGLVSRFEWLRAKPKDEPSTLPVYIAFDILELAGRDLRDRPLNQRRRVLERLVWHHSMIFPARRLADDGLKAWQEAMARGYEGIEVVRILDRGLSRRSDYWS